MADENTRLSFAEIEYKELRNEILGIKERIIKLQLIGVSGIPLIIGAGEKYDITAVLMVSPLITLIFAFTLIFEQGSLMRVGEYIKDVIEPELAGNNILGWEAWLQSKKKRRRAEVFFAWSVHIAFAVYFALGTWLSFGAINTKLGQIVAYSGLGFYCGGFCLALYLIIANFQVGTGPAPDREKS